MAKLSGLVLASPLVTLTGAGGVGKTRLGLETAGRLLPHFSHGVWLVELAPLSNPELVPQTMVSTLGFLGSPNLSPIARLCEYLSARHMLLILDNCEHVIGIVAEMVRALLQACPRLVILATSREILGVKGEAVFRCPSLSLPGEGAQKSFSELSAFGAVRLFSERAASVSPVFALDETNAADVARICQKLDGIPLAIELAAARTRMLSPGQIAGRLEDVFSLLTTGSRGDMPRQRTLEAAIDWSYNLLDEAERRLLLCLSVFAGSWNLEAAEAVCADEPVNLLDVLGQLVDKSLVEVVPWKYGMRYHMLETIRQYARERLVQTGEEDLLRERHLDYFLAFSLEAEPKLIGPILREWRERVDAEMDNLRAAMEWSLAGSVEKGLRLITALHWYWQGRMNLGGEFCLLAGETFIGGSQRPRGTAQASVQKDRTGQALNVIAHWGVKKSAVFGREAGEIFAQMGDAYRLDWAIAMIWSGERPLLELLVIFREIGDRFYLTYILWILFMAVVWEGDLPQARRYLEESISLNREIGYIEGEAVTLTALGWIIFLTGEPDQAIMILDTARNLFISAGSIGRDYTVLFLRSRFDLAQGNYRQAETNFKKYLTHSQDMGIHGNSAQALSYLGWVALLSDDLDLVDYYLNEAKKSAVMFRGFSVPEYSYVLARIAISCKNYSKTYFYLRMNALHPSYFGRRIDTTVFLASYGPLMVEIYARLATARENMAHAAILFGALDRYPWLKNILPQPDREADQQALASVRAALGGEEFAAAWAQGQAMNASQALAYAEEHAPVEE